MLFIGVDKGLGRRELEEERRGWKGGKGSVCVHTLYPDPVSLWGPWVGGASGLGGAIGWEELVGGKGYWVVGAIG